MTLQIVGAFISPITSHYFPCNIMGNIHQNDKGSCLSWIAQIFQPGMRNWSASSVRSTGIGTGYIGNHIDFKCSESSLGLTKREAQKLSSFYATG